MGAAAGAALSCKSNVIGYLYPHVRVGRHITTYRALRLSFSGARPDRLALVPEDVEEGMVVDDRYHAGGP